MASLSELCEQVTNTLPSLSYEYLILGLKTRKVGRGKTSVKFIHSCKCKEIQLIVGTQNLAYANNGSSL